MKKSVCSLIAALITVSGVGAQITGPSTSTAPYVVPNSAIPPGSVTTISLLTTGDDIGGYRLPGIPDGMGIFGTPAEATLVTTHELGAGQGVVRAHGATGALVSRVTLDPATWTITTARDHNTSSADVYVYDRVTSSWAPGVRAWDRFCSADLAPTSAFQFGGLGTSARLFLGGEESRPPFAPGHGAAWAHIVSGPNMNQSWELPHLGQTSFENAVASPFPQVKTIVVGLDDSDAQVNPALTTQPSEIYVYIGEKRATGNEIEKAGLVGGPLYGMRVRVGGVVVPQESNAFGFGTTSYVGSAEFELVNLGDASTFNGAAQQTASIANDIFRTQRVEDGAWDIRPGFENDFYFVTTATGNSRLWRMRFTAIGQPELGGTIEILLAGGEGQVNLDNICTDSLGRVVMQEDTGGSSRLAKTWIYDTTNGQLIEVPADRFTGRPQVFPTPRRRLNPWAWRIGLILALIAVGAAALLTVTGERALSDMLITFAFTMGLLTAGMWLFAQRPPH